MDFVYSSSLPLNKIHELWLDIYGMKALQNESFFFFFVMAFEKKL